MARHYPYLIIGGGMAADAAARGIRMVDDQQPIGLISEEPDPPYNRPPLSKGLWKTSPRPMPLSRIWRGTAKLGVDMILGRKAVQLQPRNKIVRDDQGEEYHYDRLLLATGGDPIRLGVEHERVIYFRNLKDYQRLRELAASGQHFGVIGGGLIGSEIAAALAGQGKEVTILFPEPGIAARILPAEIAAFLNGYFSDRGVRVLSGHMVTAIEAGSERVTIRTDQGKAVQVDGVVAGLGIRPNLSLAKEAGLEVGNGILVNSFLQTSEENIFAAGDVVNFYNPQLGKRMRVEHEENANLTGQIAGQNMAGSAVPYETLPFAFSAIFDLSYDIVGELDPRMQVVFDWQEPFQKGCAYTLEQGKVRGVLLWNLPGRIEAARQVIAAGENLLPGQLAGRIR